MNIILSLIIACTIALGAPSQPSEQPLQAACMEDMECWDSSSMGQQLPRLTDNEIDAWERVSVLAILPASDAQTLDYIETLDYRPVSLPFGHFLLSSTTPNHYHVMHWVTLYKA